ncbi:MAG: CorA family divalent cation transporter [bacterium]|nr:CorA family divalent cation transporter [bacterium]
METIKSKAVVWHNIYRPTKENINWLREHFNFHELVLAELMKPTIRPKVQKYDGYLYLVLHFPIFDETERKTYPREIDFILTKKELITVSFEPIPPLEDFFKKCAIDKSCKELYASKNTMHLLYYLISNFYEFSMRELDHIQERISIIEEEIFSGKEREVVKEISVVGRDIIDFRRSLKPQEITLTSLAAQAQSLFSSDVLPFLEDLAGVYQKLWGLLENHKETLDALYETNTTLLNIKQSDVMKTLTVMAFMTFPLAVLATLLVSNTVSNPLAGHPADFWIILGILATTALTILGIFKKKKWI